MRITEAAQRLGTSPRMLRYRDSLGLLPRVRDAAAGAGHRHRQFGDPELDAVTAALRLEPRYDLRPAELASGLRVLAEPSVRAAVADLGRRVGRLPEAPGRALDFEKERALRLLAGPARGGPSDASRSPGPRPAAVFTPAAQRAGLPGPPGR